MLKASSAVVQVHFRPAPLAIARETTKKRKYVRRGYRPLSCFMCSPHSLAGSGRVSATTDPLGGYIGVVTGGLDFA